MTGSDDDHFLQKFINNEDNIIVEMLDLESIDKGAYIVNIESDLST